MSDVPIPLLDLAQEVDELWEELNAALQRVLRSGHFIMGPDVAALEAECAAYLGITHAIAVNSGTDALLIALRAAGIGPGDEVLTSPFTFFATAGSIELAGATPAFVDIDPRTFNLDAAQLADRVTPQTRAIVPVHLYGQAADMPAILAVARQHGLKVIEDAAQALGGEGHGQKVGTQGDAGIFSFFPSKNLGAYGDGGLIVTNDDAVAAAARMLRVHGARQKYHNEVVGYNSRLDTLQAAILRVKLPHLDDWNQARRLAAQRYDDLLRDIPGIVTPFQADYARHVYHQYTLRVGDHQRQALKDHLAAGSISSMIYYPVPLHRLPVYRHLAVELPQAEAAAAEVLSLPIGPRLTADTQISIADRIRSFRR